MVEKKIIEKKKVKVIKSVGVDTEKFCIDNYTDEKITNLKKKFGLENKIIILMVARAIWDKGIKEYYRAAELIKKNNLDTEFLLVGGTDKGNHCCASETFLKEGSVRWLGYRDDVVDLTAICDVYTLPSYREGLPATLMEAASMSKPIVTTNTTGCREVVENGENGFLIPVKDPFRLADKINILIQNKNLRSSMGIKGREKALNEFSIDKIVAQYISYYENKLGYL
jgi:N,N'-diacetylbacillosaminyl-diphospho-undecaprenol alpha-1,3-N-acetylgalactosaminyltransferase